MQRDGHKLVGLCMGACSLNNMESDTIGTSFMGAHEGLLEAILSQTGRS